MSCCRGCCCGGRNPADIQDEHVINSFRTAVNQHNQANGLNLEFVKILSATQQVVAGFMFEGVVEVNENGEASHYNVKVWVKPGGQEHVIQHFIKA